MWFSHFLPLIVLASPVIASHAVADVQCCWLRLHRQWVAMPFGLSGAPYFYLRVTAITEDFITTTA